MCNGTVVNYGEKSYRPKSCGLIKSWHSIGGLARTKFKNAQDGWFLDVKLFMKKTNFIKYFLPFRGV